MTVTIGISFILLSVLERIRNRFTQVTTVFGRTALFYYALHFLVMHIALTILFFIQGEHTAQEAIDAEMPFLFVMPGEGFSLGVVYVIWITLVVSLYPVCRWYDRYKTSHKEKWWLSYL
jgi:predicted acyltransferase